MSVAQMSIALMPLPYDLDALAPAISADTLAVHHGKHHKAYVDKLNAAIADGPLADRPLEAIVAAARDKEPGLFNNAAQSWNHGFYWMSMSPKPTQPDAALTEALRRDFGSAEKVAAELASRGAGHFASGWVWLAADANGRLSIEETHDADTLADNKDKAPLLVIDVWEHAYYLDHKNVRPDYLAAVTGKLLNWEFASARYAGNRWTYPG